MEEKSQQVEIQLDVDGVPRHYSNHVVVQMNPNDRTLSLEFVDVGFIQEEKITDSGKLILKPVTRVILSTHVIPGFIKAIEAQIARHEPDTSTEES